jgi:phosphotransferase system enzyme I (PtsP)
MRTGRQGLPGPGEGLVGLVAEREEPVNLEDAELHPNFQLLPDIGEEPFHAFLGVPIIHQREVLGVLVVQQARRRRFDESEEAFLVTMSAQLAGVIAHALVTGDVPDEEQSGERQRLHADQRGARRPGRRYRHRGGRLPGGGPVCRAPAAER